MAAIISKQNIAGLAIEAMVSPLTNYFVEKANPSPHRFNLLALSIVDAIVRRSIMLIGHKIADQLTEKAGYKHRGKITNNKFMYLNQAFSFVIPCLLPIFYRSIGQKLNLQLPNYLLTLAYLTLNTRASFVVINTISAFVPAPVNAK